MKGKLLVHSVWLVQGPRVRLGQRYTTGEAHFYRTFGKPAVCGYPFVFEDMTVAGDTARRCRDCITMKRRRG